MAFVASEWLALYPLLHGWMQVNPSIYQIKWRLLRGTPGTRHNAKWMDSWYTYCLFLSSSFSIAFGMGPPCLSSTSLLLFATSVLLVSHSLATNPVTIYTAITIVIPPFYFLNQYQAFVSSLHASNERDFRTIPFNEKKKGVMKRFWSQLLSFFPGTI